MASRGIIWTYFFYVTYNVKKYIDRYIYMEDKNVKLGLYAYQFRVDISIETGLTRVMEFINKYNVQYYIAGAETSSLGKQHFQCILWFKDKINTSKLRNWWKGKADTTDQPVSLTTAKKIKNLAKYTMKEKNFTTNLTKEEIKLIGQWAPKAKAAEWSEMLDEHAKKYVVNQEEIQGECFDDNNYYQTSKIEVQHFVCYLLEYYKANSRKPSRATLQYLAWKHGHMTNQHLAQAWF